MPHGGAWGRTPRGQKLLGQCRGRKDIFVQRVVSRPSYLLSGLVAQSEITTLLNWLYGSYGERLVANYQRGTKEAMATSTST